MTTIYNVAKVGPTGRVEKYERPAYTTPAEVLEAARKLAQSWPVDRLRIHESFNQLYKLDDFEKKIK